MEEDSQGYAAALGSQSLVHIGGDVVEKLQVADEGADAEFLVMEVEEVDGVERRGGGEFWLICLRGGRAVEED